MEEMQKEQNIPNETTKQEKQEKQKFTEQIYIGKTKKYLKIAIGFLIFDLFTYIFFAFLGEYDFGVFFEGGALILALLAIYFLNRSSISSAKHSILIGLLAIGWLFFYDIFDFLFYFDEILQASFHNGIFYSFSAIDLFLLIIFIFYISAYRSLLRSQRPVNYESDKDWFYDEK